LRWREGMGRTQARVVLGVLVLGLLGGAAGMARCPQLVSFSEAALPLPEEMQALPGSDLQNVVFHPAGTAHETLLKASMPSSGGELKTAGQALQQRSPRSSRFSRSTLPALRRMKKTPTRRQQQWLVLTSWNVQATEPGNQSGDESRGAKMVLTVSHEQNFYPSYAAVRTAGGWLFFQL